MKLMRSFSVAALLISASALTATADISSTEITTETSVENSTISQVGKGSDNDVGLHIGGVHSSNGEEIDGAVISSETVIKDSTISREIVGSTNRARVYIGGVISE
jgi:hypothetical protein